MTPSTRNHIAMPRVLTLRSATSNRSSGMSSPAPAAQRTSEQVKVAEGKKKATRQQSIAQNQAAISTAARKHQGLLRKQQRDDDTANSPATPGPATPMSKISRPRPEQTNAIEGEHGMSCPPGDFLFCCLEKVPASPEEQPSEPTTPEPSSHGHRVSEEEEDGLGLQQPEIEVSDGKSEAEYSDASDDLVPERPRKKGETRGLIDSLGQLDEEIMVDSTGVDHKRKASQSTGDSEITPSRKKKPKATPIPSGLRPGYAVARNSGTLGSAQRGAEAGEEDSPGGISDNESGEAHERQILGDVVPERERLLRRSGVITAVVEKGRGRTTGPTVAQTTSVPMFVPPTESAVILSNRKSAITISHLPVNLRVAFNSTFLPLVYQSVGHSDSPWLNPNLKVLCDLWKKTFPTKDAFTDDATLKKVVETLTSNGIASWRHKFADHALTCLEEPVFGELPESDSVIEAIETRRCYVEWCLDGGDRERNFYYREVEYCEVDEVETGSPNSEPAEVITSGPVIRRRGIFQSKVIVSTLGVYYSSIATLTPGSELRSKAFPHAALVLVLQAMYDTGVKIQLSGTLGHFSRVNWADHDEVREGKSVTIRSTSLFVFLTGYRIPKPLNSKFEDISKLPPPNIAFDDMAFSYSVWKFRGSLVATWKLTDIQQGHVCRLPGVQVDQNYVRPEKPIYCSGLNAALSLDVSRLLSQKAKWSRSSNLGKNRTLDRLSHLYIPSLKVKVDAGWATLLVKFSAESSWGK
ncbi:hypothetical protein BKA70DRAFT_1225455 [Coprinopsis sp. MPI-PUGE-AT-0042]|nr:hypothetical protein BKA70DRAFT_1225455 [Coprinopsis sp. MPI-PUGE-AT-0042]